MVPTGKVVGESYPFQGCSNPPIPGSTTHASHQPGITNFNGPVTINISVVNQESFCMIPLSGPKAMALHTEAIIDVKHKDLVEQHGPWRLDSKGYAVANIHKNGKRTNIKMHRLIAGIADNPDLEVDHVNGNPLDNREYNLFMGLRNSKAFRSLQNRRQKCYGAAEARGVHWREACQKYQVQMTDENGVYRHLGYRVNLNEASALYEQAFADIVTKLEATVRQELAEYHERQAMEREDFDVGA